VWGVGTNTIYWNGQAPPARPVQRAHLAEIESPDFPDEPLVVCRNPALAQERARKREDLLAATEAKLAPIVARVEAGTLRGADKIGLAVGRVIDRHKVGKHFELDIAADPADRAPPRDGDRGRGGARRAVRAADLAAGRAARERRCRPRVQELLTRRARVPQLQGGRSRRSIKAVDQGGRSRRPPDPSLGRATGPGPRLPVPASVLRPVAS